MSNNIAYHYTSLDSLYKIVTTKSLLLTDLAGMNDPEEGKYSPEDFLDDLKKGRDSFLKDENSIKFFDVIIAELEIRKDEFFKLCKMGKKEPFTLALSDKPDSLQHWERYGNQLKGVCISIDLDRLDDLRSMFPSIFQIRKVLYKSEDISRQILRDIIKTYNMYSEELNKEGKTLDIDTIKKSCCTQFAVQYRSMTYFIKKDFWNSEDEIRVFYDHESWKESERFFKNVNFPEKFVTAAKNVYEVTGLEKPEYMSFSTIRKCHRLSLRDEWDLGIIPEIKLGTYCRQNKKILKQFLKEYGLGNIKITDSKIKIR